MEIRPFHVLDSYSEGVIIDDRPVAGITVELEGRIAGYGGLFKFESHDFVFFQINNDGIKKPLFLHRIVMGGLMAARASGIREVFALLDANIPRAAEWLRHLDFHPLEPHKKTDAIRRIEAHTKQSTWIKEWG